MHRLVAALVIAIAFALPSAAPAQQARHALVIGNWSYDTAPLKNPKNDVRDMAKTLRGLGFDVVALENGTQREMRYAILDFGRALREDGGFGLFFFAGHGVQVEGRNFLIPVDALIELEEEVPIEAIDVATVLARMEAAGNGLNVVILDACRNNPFARSFRSASTGLASIDAPAGTLLAYATAPGQVASDGTGTNGLYTGELIKAMTVRDITVEEAFKSVRAAVMKESGGKQIPWESTSLTGTLSFAPPAEAKPAEKAPPAQGAEAEADTRALSSAIRAREGRRRLGHYATADGLVGFVLDRTGDSPAVRYDGSAEILALTPVVRRDETVFQVDTGGAILRVPTGRTLEVWVAGRGWDPVERDGGADPLRVPPADRAEAEVAVTDAAAALKTYLGIDAAITVDWQRLGDAPGTVVGALASLTAAAKRAVEDPLARQVVATNLKSVHLTAGDQAEVKADGKTVAVHMAPNEGLAGHPSSHRLFDALTAEALAMMKMRQHAEETFERAAARTSKECGRPLGMTLDWSTVTSKDRGVGWCTSVSDALNRLCGHPVGKAAVAERIRGLHCKFGAERSVDLDDTGRVTFTYDRRSPNNSQHLYKALMNRL